MSDYTTDGKGQNTMGKKLQPKLRFKGFTDDWEPRRLKSLHRQPLLVSPVPSQTYISWSVPAFSTGEPEIVKGSEIESVKQSVNSSDVLLCRINPRINRVWVVEARKDTDLPMIASTEWVVFTGHNSDSYFLSALFTSSRFRNMLLSEVAGVTGSQKRFQIASVLERQEYFPTQIEQARIGLLFAKVDNLIAAEKRKLDLLQKKKRALLRQIFEQKLRFAGYNNPWERCRLGDITEFADYGIAASAIPYDGTVRYLRITDIDDETRQVNIYELPSPDMKHRSRKEDYLRQGDLVFARTGASVGKTYLNRSDRDDIVHAGFLIRFRLKDNICPEFIYQQTLGENYRKFIAITSQRSGQPGINSSEYADWTLYLTSIEEQNQIGGLFGQLDELIAALTQKIDLLMIKKKALLQQMFV